MISTFLVLHSEFCYIVHLIDKDRKYGYHIFCIGNFKELFRKIKIQQIKNIFLRLFKGLLSIQFFIFIYLRIL